MKRKKARQDKRRVTREMARLAVGGKKATRKKTSRH